MSQIEVHKLISKTNSVFYGVGIWHRGDVESVGGRGLKLFYFIYFCVFIISLVAEALASDRNGAIFMTQIVLVAIVALVKLLYIMWRKKEFLELLNNICVYSVDDRDTFAETTNKMGNLMTFLTGFLCLSYSNIISAMFVAPFVGKQKILVINFAFPLDYRNDEFAFSLAYAFLFTQVLLASTTWLFTVNIWYLMASCGLRHKVLGQKIKTMGEDHNHVRKVTNRDNLYLRHLIQAIESHNHLTESAKWLNSFFSELFMVQLATSGLYICCSIYSLAFNSGTNIIEVLVNIVTFLYALFDIFMVMYFGNEIQLGSDRLSYCLFESDWMDRSEFIKKNVVIFGEFLRQPRQLIILKLYPLTLETFRRILTLAYNMFNILRNLN